MSTPIINAIIGRVSDSTSQYKLMVLVGNREIKDLIGEPNTKYIIKYNFDLHGEKLEMPTNCILAIDGGSISNGEIEGNNTTLLNVNKAGNIFNSIELSGTWGLNVAPSISDNLSLVYFDKDNNKLLWWDGNQFIELITV